VGIPGICILTTAISREDDAKARQRAPARRRSGEGTTASERSRAGRSGSITPRHYVKPLGNAFVARSVASSLGEHVMQKGSLVEAKRLRFDFFSSKALTRQSFKRRALGQSTNSANLASTIAYNA